MFAMRIAIVLVFAASTAIPALADDAKRRAKLAEISHHQETVMVPMRDGVRLATDIYRPRDTTGKHPAVFWRTPYNFHEIGGMQLNLALAFVQRGYVFIVQNERGKFHSEGHWEILGHPRTDGYDALTWIAAQPWSNGKVGTIGCSSSAEWQLALAATDHPAHAAMVPMASGAGIGRVGEFYEQGNWYRGGTMQVLFLTWLYGVQNTQRPMLPPNLSDADRVRLSRYYDLAPEMPKVNWEEKIWHLPFVEVMEEVDGPKGIFAEFMARKPNDPAWYKGGLYHDNEDFGVPALWLNSWYDVSVGPNLELFNHVRRNATDPVVRANQFAIVAPTLHCAFFRSSEDLIVGERSMGDARFPYKQTIVDFFDRWLKGTDNGFEKEHPAVRYYTMGTNAWATADTWPPAKNQVKTLFLDSDGKANTLNGNGRLLPEPPSGDGNVDRFTYDPANPVPSLGGGVCCIGKMVDGGSFDQRSVEEREDVLVYTSEPLQEPLNITGTIRVILNVSSSARDTDFMVKLIDVHPDGRAYNVDDSMQRVRYRAGYDREVFMEKGNIYELKISPMTTSNVFLPGHRVRLEVTSSSFPRVARNLNTGGPNYNESKPVIAHNAVHHSPQHRSRIEFMVLEEIPRPQEANANDDQ